MKRLLNWLDDRTGYRALLHEVLYENIPGGARWRYVWGSTLSFTFMVQLITGFFLWMCYSPSARSALLGALFSCLAPKRSRSTGSTASMAEAAP